MKLITLRTLGGGLSLVLLAGCSNWAFHDAKQMVADGQVTEGMARVEDMAAKEPDNAMYKAYLLRQKEASIGRLLLQGQSALATDNFNQAEEAFRAAALILPHDDRVKLALRQVESGRRHAQLAQQAESLQTREPETALQLAKMVLSESPAHVRANRVKRAVEAERHRAQMAPPQLAANLKKQVNLEFREAPLSSVFEVLARSAGLNFIFDRDVQGSTKVTIFARNTSVEDALNVIMTTSQLEKKILNESTILVYPNSPAKKADYQENVVKSFYIGNADPKQTMNLVKTMVKTRDVFIDEKLGMMTVRDTPEAVKIVERLLAAQDLAEPEVLLEVEVLEVSTSRLQNLGIQWPGQIALSATSNTTTLAPGTLSLNELRGLDGRSLRSTVSDPLAVLNFRATDGLTNLLANPRIRVKSREKAKIRIGDKVPVVTTTTVATGVSTESVSYQDVGLNLDVDPVVHPDNHVTIKVALEVSNIVREITSKSGLLTYQIGQRRAETVLRLKDGETQVLAGLIRREERDTATKVPGLGDFPVLGRLFSTNGDNHEKTEIVLLVTPRIVRTLDPPPVHITEFVVGSDNYTSTEPLRLKTASSLSMPNTQGASAVQPVAAVAARPGPEPTPADNASPVTFDMRAPARAAPGQEFELGVIMNAKVDVKSVAIDIDYDPTKLEFVTARTGPMMGSNGGTPTLEARSETGRAHVAVANPGGSRGNGELAVLVFRGKQAGQEPVWFGLGGAAIQDVAGKEIPLAAPEPRSVIIAP